jgi:RHS repeat-associated protein
MGRFWRGVGLLAALLIGILAMTPAAASAEPLCTDTWTGPAEGYWTTAEDWSSGEVPTSSTVACIGTGRVIVTSGVHQVGVLEDKGNLYLLSSTLEFTNTLEASKIATLTLYGTLSGAAEVDVTGSFVGGESGRLEGSGSLVIESGATGSVNEGNRSPLYLEERTLVNDGTFTVGEDGVIDASKHAKLVNNATFKITGEQGIGGEATLVNMGTVEKTEGSGNTPIGFAIENEGTVSVTSGSLVLNGGGASGVHHVDSWIASGAETNIFFQSGSTSTSLGSSVSLSGRIIASSGTITAGKIEAPSGEIVADSGTVEVTGASASTVSRLLVLSGNLSGSGEVDVTSYFQGGESGRLEGSGSLVIESGATGSVNEGNRSPLYLEGDTLINDGTFTEGENGVIEASKHAKFVNSATLEITGEHGLGGEATLVNTGTVEKTEGSGSSPIGFVMENEGTVSVTSGQLSFGGGGTSGTHHVGVWTASGTGTSIAFSSSTFSLGATATLSGLIDDGSATLTAGKIEMSSGEIFLNGGTIDITGTGASASKVSGLLVLSGRLTGPGEMDITSYFQGGEDGTLEGTGSLVIESGATGIVNEGNSSKLNLEERTLVNKGTFTIGTKGGIVGSKKAKFVNSGTLTNNGEPTYNDLGLIAAAGEALLTNTGTVQKTEGTGSTAIQFGFENLGSIRVETGTFEIPYPVAARTQETQWGEPEGGLAPGQIRACRGDPVSCATGDFSEAQTDFTVGGRGVGLNLMRTYNSQAAAEGIKGAFGYGWTSSFSDHLVVNKTSKVTTLYQAEGSTVPFTEGTGGSFTAPNWTQDTLSGTEGTGYTLTLASQIKYKFAGSSGRLESVTDRDGNATTLTYNEAGQLTTITDPVSRTVKLKYNGEGLVESAEDPMKHVVKYTYEGGNLKSVTQPAEAGLRWQFKYDGSHRMTEMVDGRGGKTINEYNGSNQVSKQEDPAGHKLKFEYESFQTKITNENTGSVTDEYFTSNDEPSSITRGYGTASATTESFAYNVGGYVTSMTDGDGHTTTYGYSTANDRTSMVDANKNETKWTYDSTHDVETMTTPKGEKTTIKRETHGNPEVIERPAPASTTQITKYKYGTHGELESVEDPLKNVWKYGYNTHGDRTSETDPESNKRTWEYNEDSQETSTVSPRGNVTEGKPTEFTTKIERDAQGRPLKITDPLSHTTKYTYDGDGNVETVTDGNSHKTKYTYNGDNEPTKVEEANKTITETEYDGAGQVVKQIDGNKHATKYVRNVLEQVTEVEDPLKHKTLKEYDLAGNLKKLTDPAKRTTTYTYDPGNRLTAVVYSSGKPSTVKYEYDKDGDRTKMTDGTGTTKYTYDQLDRLTESENGHKEKIKYEYNLANGQTKITYPNEKAVTREFDKDERLDKVTDWNKKETKFTYDPDSDLKATVFPSETKDEDTYAYNDADQMSEVKMLKAAESLASLVYTRDSDGQVKKTTSKGLPGAEVTENTYDENNRLTKYGSTEYKYDAANNPTKEGSTENKFNEGDELEKGTGTTYAYDELGERTKTTPEKGPVTTYGYDQAGDLTSVERPKEGEVAEIKDAYAYNGEGLRASQTISGTTTYMAWDMAKELPLLLSDGTNSYIYGPGGLPVEQINNSTGTTSYLHHDQAGSTRLLTGSAGTVEGKCTYGPYGTPTCEGTATTPLGYDGQYTSSDTGLIYLRNRVYDPSTAQFLTVDPAVGVTQAPYNYGGDNPVNRRDPDGLSAEGIEGVPCYFPFCGPPPPAVEGVQHGIETVGNGIESVWSAVNENEGPNDEGEAALKEKEAQRAKECGEPNSGSLEKLKKGEIERILNEDGSDIHTDKEQTVGKEAGGSYDYYRDKSTGEIYLIPKDGGEPIPTGLGG